jgi:hypothetical protein
LDYILDNPSQGSRIPLGVLKANHIFFSKGKFLTLLKVNLVTLLKGKLVIRLKIVKITILPWVTLVILPRAKWVSLSFYGNSSTNESYFCWSKSIAYGRTCLIQLSTTTSLRSY